MAEFRMPSLGADMDEGILLEWRVHVGDRVTKGQVVAEVDTEKSVIEVETFDTGTVTEILVPEGERVPVGTPLAVISADDEAPATAAHGVAAPAVRPPASSPRARRRAAELGVDLATVAGTGPGGAITADDVERAAGQVAEAQAEASVPPEPAEAGEPLSGAERQAALRRAIAAAMARSKREIPHYYLTSEIDVTALTGWLEDRNATAPVTHRVLPAAALLKATALAVRQVPALNGVWEEGELRRSEAIHLGVAIALRGGGLVAPAIHDADAATLEELMAALRDLVGRARAGRIRSSEMSDPSITVTNLGDEGVDVVMPVIYPPQVAIVGFGRIRERPRVVEGAVVPRTTVVASLGADHRVSDGRVGARFLAELDRVLQRPEVI